MSDHSLATMTLPALSRFNLPDQPDHPSLTDDAEESYGVPDAPEPRNPGEVAAKATPAMRPTRPRKAARDKAIVVYRHLIRGLQPAEIAAREGLPERTVYWHIQEGGRVLGQELKMLTAAGLLRELFVSHRERKRALWALHESTKQDVVKVACLTKLAEEDDRLWVLLSRMGLVQRSESVGGALDALAVESAVRQLQAMLTEEQRHQLVDELRQSARPVSPPVNLP